MGLAGGQNSLVFERSQIDGAGQSNLIWRTIASARLCTADIRRFDV